jgi:ferredoxin/flavodoxin---NADP+ reductase
MEVCPVDCIHPAPDENGFRSAEMLYIDPAVCIDCGVCVAECPVDAIYPADELPESMRGYQKINADFFIGKPPTRPFPLRTVSPPGLPGAAPLRVAVVGSGPAGCYAALNLLQVGGAGCEVDIYDKLPTPWGLVRSGVAPDHPGTKGVTRLFAEMAGNRRLRFLLNVEVGLHLSTDELASHYHAVIYATGAPLARSLGIQGEDLAGSHAATEFVAWYNGHPDFADRVFDLSGTRAVVIGNGNVALDIARVLLADPAALRKTDIASHALQALCGSSIREVVLVGRRSAMHAACTTPELLALGQLQGVAVTLSPADLVLSKAEQAHLEKSHVLRAKYEIFRHYAVQPLPAAQPPSVSDKRLTFRFLESPIQLLGEARSVHGVLLGRNRVIDDASGSTTIQPTGAEQTLETGFVLRSLGYRGAPVCNLPFDRQRDVIANRSGRVTNPATGEPVPGAYVVGWIKRGPSGVIGTNKHCARETVAALLEDARSGALGRPAFGSHDIDALLALRQPEQVSWEGWRNIDRSEQFDGAQSGRPRVKLTSRTALLKAAATQRHEVEFAQ